MIFTEERICLRNKWQRDNPEIRFDLYEWNYGWNMQAIYGTFCVTEKGKTVLMFTAAHEYFDRRKPNEIQTTD